MQASAVSRGTGSLYLLYLEEILLGSWVSAVLLILFLPSAFYWEPLFLSKKTKKQVDHDHPSKTPPKMTRPRSKPRSLQGGELSLVDSRERAIINSNSTAYAPT
mmetsp:Transcript_31141/g.53262  ORF Transcript_31141/g.53262 Transcript_31141/m.53262 type:complete len:104 (+) Transcript_31141:1979-2290(+)